MTIMDVKFLSTRSDAKTIQERLTEGALVTFKSYSPVHQPNFVKMFYTAHWPDKESPVLKCPNACKTHLKTISGQIRAVFWSWEPG